MRGRDGGLRGSWADTWLGDTKLVLEIVSVGKTWGISVMLWNLSVVEV